MRKWSIIQIKKKIKVFEFEIVPEILSYHHPIWKVPLQICSLVNKTKMNRNPFALCTNLAKLELKTKYLLGSFLLRPWEKISRTERSWKEGNLIWMGLCTWFDSRRTLPLQVMNRGIRNATRKNITEKEIVCVLATSQAPWTLRIFVDFNWEDRAFDQKIYGLRGLELIFSRFNCIVKKTGASINLLSLSNSAKVI